MQRIPNNVWDFTKDALVHAATRVVFIYIGSKGLGMTQRNAAITAATFELVRTILSD